MVANINLQLHVYYSIANLNRGLKRARRKYSLHISNTNIQQKQDSTIKKSIVKLITSNHSTQKLQNNYSKTPKTYRPQFFKAIKHIFTSSVIH